MHIILRAQTTQWQIVKQGFIMYKQTKSSINKENTTAHTSYINEALLLRLFPILQPQ